LRRAVGHAGRRVAIHPSGAAPVDANTHEGSIDTAHFEEMQ